MGATVTTGKRVGAFRDGSGTAFYILFEETYEKNCYPHTPDWGCLFIGDLAGAIRAIFHNASVCEGGMLQNRSGHITPEGYVAGWLKEMATPYPFADRPIALSVRDRLSSPIPTGELGRIGQMLVGCGHTDIAEALKAGDTVALSLHGDAAVLATVYTIGGLSPWRIIPAYVVPQRYMTPCRDLAYAPVPAKGVSVDLPDARRLGGDDVLLRREDGSWYCAGWQYSLVAQYVKSLWRSELAQAGSYRKRIGAYRAHLSNAPRLPDGVIVSVDATMATDDWQRRAVAEFSATYPVAPTARGFTVHPTKDNAYRLASLPRDCTTWLLPDDDALSVRFALPEQQLALL